MHRLQLVVGLSVAIDDPARGAARRGFEGTGWHGAGSWELVPKRGNRSFFFPVRQLRGESLVLSRRKRSRNVPIEARYLLQSREVPQLPRRGLQKRLHAGPWRRLQPRLCLDG